MKLWVQRVSEASVTVESKVSGQIGNGFLVLIGMTHTDTETELEKCLAKLLGLRVFEDPAGQMNLSVRDTNGSVLVVSQFTLYADTRKGNRPGFSDAAPPTLAEPLYNRFVERLRQELSKDRVATGVFGAYMQVRLLNDGPVSIEIRFEAQSN